MSEIVIKDIKTAIKKRIATVFPNAKYYVDGEIKSYPAFYIRTTNIELENQGLRRSEKYGLTFYMRVEYRDATEPLSVTGLNSKLDNVGMALMETLRFVELYGLKFYPVQLNNETIDNVRIFDFYITINATYEKLEEIKMQNVGKEQNIKE